MTKEKKLINNLPDLNYFVFKQNSEISLKLTFNFYSLKENDSKSAEINKLINACGCNTGKYFSALAIIICVIGLFQKVPLFQTSLFKIILIFSVIVFISAIIGKIAGLMLAQIKLKNIVHNIERDFANLNLSVSDCDNSMPS